MEEINRFYYLHFIDQTNDFIISKQKLFIHDMGVRGAKIGATVGSSIGGIVGMTEGIRDAFFPAPKPATIRHQMNQQNFQTGGGPLYASNNPNDGIFLQDPKKSKSIESLVRHANSQPVGFNMSGSDIAKFDSRLSKASSLLDGIEKVNNGLKIDLTWAGRTAIGLTPHNIPDGTIFQIKDVILQDKKHALMITANGATFNGSLFLMYLRGDSYMTSSILNKYGVLFVPIFNK